MYILRYLLVCTQYRTQSLIYTYQPRAQYTLTSREPSIAYPYQQRPQYIRTSRGPSIHVLAETLVYSYQQRAQYTRTSRGHSIQVLAKGLVYPYQPRPQYTRTSRDPSTHLLQQTPSTGLQHPSFNHCCIQLRHRAQKTQLTTSFWLVLEQWYVCFKQLKQVGRQCCLMSSDVS